MNTTPVFLLALVASIAMMMGYPGAAIWIIFMAAAMLAVMTVRYWRHENG